MNNEIIKYECKICNKFHIPTHLSQHLNKTHNIILKNYYIKYYLSGNIPRCLCGCGQEVSFKNLKIGFNKFIRGHGSTLLINNDSNHILTNNEMSNIISNYKSVVRNKILKCNFTKTYNFILNTYTSTLTNKFVEKLYQYINGINDIPKCKYCNKNSVNSFITINKGYAKYCSKSCRAFDMQSTYKSTLKRKYGNEFYNNEDKRKITFLKKYKNELYFKSDDYKEKIKNKYGVEIAMHSNVIKDRIQKTSMLRYNTKYPNQSSIIQQKNQNSGYKFKSFILPSGKEIKVQGYEPFGINYLINDKKYKEEDIVINRSEIPHFSYILNEKECVYFPDMYIKSTKTIIEVKSTWTNKINAKINNLKKKSVIDNGFNFEKLIFNAKGELLN